MSSDPSCLKTAESAKIVFKVLSTAGSRAPQKHLFAAIQNHISSMTADENGCSILTSLVRFGTKQTVGKLLPEIFGNLNAKSLTKASSDLVRFATGRPECSEEADKSTAKVVKILTADPSLPNAIRALPNVASSNVKVLESQSFKKAYKGSTKDDRKLFVKSFVESTKDAPALDLLWKLINFAGATEEEAEEIIKAGKPIVDTVAKYIRLEGKEHKWVKATAACIRSAGDEEASSLVDQVLSSPSQDAALTGAIQLRYPDRVFERPDLAAAATKWTRSHQNVFNRTRETVQARIAQKRPRDDEDEF